MIYFATCTSILLRELTFITIDIWTFFEIYRVQCVHYFMKYNSHYLRNTMYGLNDRNSNIFSPRVTFDGEYKTLKLREISLKLHNTKRQMQILSNKYINTKCKMYYKNV